MKVLEMSQINLSGTRTGLTSTGPTMIPSLCRTSAPIRSALSLLRQSSPHRLVNAYHLISRSHIPWRHKYGTCGIVSSTAASSDSTIKLVQYIQSMRTTPHLTLRVLILLKHEPLVCYSEISDTSQVKGTLSINIGSRTELTFTWRS